MTKWPSNARLERIDAWCSKQRSQNNKEVAQRHIKCINRFMKWSGGFQCSSKTRLRKDNPTLLGSLVRIVTSGDFQVGEPCVTVGQEEAGKVIVKLAGGKIVKEE